MKIFASFIVFVFLGTITSFSQTKPKAGAASGTLSASVDRGKLIYLQQCLSCHMMDGMGVPNMNPPIVKTAYVSGDKVRLIKIVLNGFTEKVDINGEQYSNVMAPHNFLKDQEIADVLTYVRNSFGNKGTAVKPAEVKAARAAKK